MDDTISRQAAIDALGEEPEVWLENDQYELGLNNQWNYDIDALKAVPSAEPHWIPVTERLPEDGAEVWVTTELLSEVTRACWHKDTNLWCHPYHSNCLLALRPIAWMELFIPEPYKGGAE